MTIHDRLTGDQQIAGEMQMLIDLAEKKRDAALARAEAAEARVTEFAPLMDILNDQIAARDAQIEALIYSERTAVATAGQTIAALITAGDRLRNEYATHDLMCAMCDPDADVPLSCSCGFDAAVTAYDAASKPGRGARRVGNERR